MDLGFVYYLVVILATWLRDFGFGFVITGALVVWVAFVLLLLLEFMGLLYGGLYCVVCV